MIDLYSDTKTKPSPDMLAHMMGASLGDSQADEDPSVNALCDKMVRYLGKEEALFLPSGTMCNQVAIAVHARPGDEVICHETAHVLHSEAGGIGAIAGATTRTLGGARGQFDADALARALRRGSQHAPRSAVVVIEQTSNFGGGSIWPMETINSVSKVARANGSALHMDGARLINAVVATGISAVAYSEPFDSVWIDFTKGLGAPFGAVLAGSAAFIARAKYFRQMLGGGLRQIGGCAAACAYALDNHVERIREDHANARYLARRISQMPGLSVESLPETNIVLFALDEGLDPGTVVSAFASAGVRIGFMSSIGKLRAIPHLDTPRTLIEEAAERMETAMIKIMGKGRRS